MKKIFRICSVGLLLSLAPLTALADPVDTSTWNFYIYPNQVAPSTPSSSYAIQVKNTTSDLIDAISLQLGMPDVEYGGSYSASTPEIPNLTYSTINTNGNIQIQFGHCGCNGNADRLGLKPGESLTLYINLTSTTIKDFVNGQYQDATDPTHSTVGNWVVNMYRWNTTATSSSTYQAQGNTTFTVTNTPHPVQQPQNFGTARTNEYSTVINSIGINDPSKITGLFPAGPVDTIIVLPITLATSLYNAMTGTVTPPSFSFLGTTLYLPDSSLIYNGLGTANTNLIAAGMNFFILLAWFKHLYSRLQRATSLQSTHSDTWGVL